MASAVATLFPIIWQEPSGLVMAESMAVGTPVIAMALGSTSEVIEDGKTGFLCHSVEERIAALDRICEIDRVASIRSGCGKIGVAFLWDDEGGAALKDTASHKGAGELIFFSR